MNKTARKLLFLQRIGNYDGDNGDDGNGVRQNILTKISRILIEGGCMNLQSHYFLCYFMDIKWDYLDVFLLSNWGKFIDI